MFVVKMKYISLLPFLCCFIDAAPKLRIMTKQMPSDLLNLPSNATSIRADISDSFSCEGREYGYYADVDNDCQLFHVCLPVTYSTGRSQTFRWSFICPEETVFNQEIFTCTRSDESIDCAESPRYYNLNNGFGDDMPLDIAHEETEAHIVNDAATHVPEVPQELDAPDAIVSTSEEPQMQEVAKSSPPTFLYNRRIFRRDH